MWAIKLYDLSTGHLQVLAEVADAGSARRWLAEFTRGGGVGTDDVVYEVEVAAPRQPAPDAG